MCSSLKTEAKVANESSLSLETSERVGRISRGREGGRESARISPGCGVCDRYEDVFIGCELCQKEVSDFCHVIKVYCFPLCDTWSPPADLRGVVLANAESLLRKL